MGCHVQLCQSQKFIKKARESYSVLCSVIGKVINSNDNSPQKESSLENQEYTSDNCNKITEVTIKEEPHKFDSTESYPNGIFFSHIDLLIFKPFI